MKVCRYVQRDPLTAKAVARAQDYPWGSLWVCSHGTAEQKSILSPWPTGQPVDWLQRVNAILTPKEREAWRLSLDRGRPFGDDAWTIQTVRALGLGHTIRREGRPTPAKGDAETT